MALTHLLSMSVIDYAGRRGTCSVHLPATLTVAQVQALSDVFAAELDPLTGAKIDSAQVALALTLPAGLKATAVDKEDISRGINWRCGAANTAYSYTVRTPAAIDALVDGEDVVENADTNDFKTFLLNGDAVNAPTDEYANDITSVDSLRVTFRK